MNTNTAEIKKQNREKWMMSHGITTTDYMDELIDLVWKEARREERKDLVEWMCNTKGVYSAHDVRISFMSYINALNNREDNASNQV